MIAFTVCSNNYLGHAKTLGDSFVRLNPGVPFVIGLVDRQRPEIDYAALGPFEILPVEALDIPSFDEFWKRYDVLELNTAFRPFFFDHLFRRDSSDVVLYVDADVLMYDSADSILQELGDGMLLLTPHALTPVPDPGPRIPQLGVPGFMEAAFLRYGLYNLGFLAVADVCGRQEFIEWWKARTARWGYARPTVGLYVDQLWMSLAPVLFEGVRLSRNPGLNMAYWNLHERRLTVDGGGLRLVNQVHPLVFFHFSGFDPREPGRLTTTSGAASLVEAGPDVTPLLADYSAKVIANGLESFQSIECVFRTLHESYVTQSSRDERARQLAKRPVSYRVYLSAHWVYRRLRRFVAQQRGRMD